MPDPRLQRSGTTAGMLVDVGTSSLTGLCLDALGNPGEAGGHRFAQAVMPTLALDAEDCRSLGSDFLRTGFLFDAPQVCAEEFTDAYGVSWLCAEGSPAPFRHPLEHASLSDIARHPRPAWPQAVQQVPRSTSGMLAVADAPCPGLLETCFALRNGWKFMEDLTDNWQAASALLDWSLETVVEAYARMLSQLQSPPDVLVYGDDYGFTGGMFLSEIDFRTFVRPRLRTLLSRLRRLSPAPICFHSCGAIRPIVADLAELGVEMLNLDPSAKAMILPEIRTQLPASIVLHAPIDLVALGQALVARDLRAVGLLTVELAQCAPAVAGPADNVQDVASAQALVHAAAYVHALDADDLARLRRFGAVRSIVENAMRSAEAAMAKPRGLTVARLTSGEAGMPHTLAR